MDYIRDYIEVITRATTISRKTLTGGRGGAVIVYTPSGEIMQLNISSSLISHFYHRGNKKDYCPLREYVTTITKKFVIPPTDSMKKGIYLESLLLGATADGNPADENYLPRHKKTGAKLSDQINIEKQAGLWEMRKQNMGIIVNSSGHYRNVQVRQKIGWKSKEYPDVEVNVYGTADLISPIRIDDLEYDMAVIDIKGCGNVDSDFGEFGWSGDSLKYKDHLQLVMYNRIFQLPTCYLVFDWNKNLGFKPIPVNLNTEHPDVEKANEARMRVREMEETIRKTIIDIMEYEKSGWMPIPGDCCKTCPHYECAYFDKIMEI